MENVPDAPFPWKVVPKLNVKLGASPCAALKSSTRASPPGKVLHVVVPPSVEIATASVP